MALILEQCSPRNCPSTQLDWDDAAHCSEFTAPYNSDRLSNQQMHRQVALVDDRLVMFVQSRGDRDQLFIHDKRRFCSTGQMIWSLRLGRTFTRLSTSSPRSDLTHPLRRKHNLSFPRALTLQFLVSETRSTKHGRLPFNAAPFTLQDLRVPAVMLEHNVHRWPELSHRSTFLRPTPLPTSTKTLSFPSSCIASTCS
ncbi:hypothetical protein CPB83DRAFT_96698 [Crepidotus variabilis]|uniref:Uncharacterized protein n=1 Tax=Crepidotus variabilis TaxID=179855 RepID=A0A9P6E4X2_9AGAR|nr:hypothetical protein CPB83DRAFT_96698 [Crepidotus variabilis]